MCVVVVVAVVVVAVVVVVVAVVVVVMVEPDRHALCVLQKDLLQKRIVHPLTVQFEQV